MTPAKGMVLILCSLMTGCALQDNFNVGEQFWKNKSARIGVVVAKLPLAHSLKMGQTETFDLSRDDPAAQDLEKYLATIDLTGINKVADGMVEYLTKRGYLAKRIPGYLDPSKLPRFSKTNNGKGEYAPEDYLEKKEKWGVDKVVVLTVETVGIARNYHANNPTGEPNGYAELSGKIVNLATNQLEWKQVVVQSVPVDDEGWDAPPKYRSLTSTVTNAYAQARVLLFNHFAAE